MNKLESLLMQLKLLVVDEKKDLCSKEVVSLSEKIDKIILKQMRNINQ